jgi:hypothetical protein
LWFACSSRTIQINIIKTTVIVDYDYNIHKRSSYRFSGIQLNRMSFNFFFFFCKVTKNGILLNGRLKKWIIMSIMNLCAIDLKYVNYVNLNFCTVIKQKITTIFKSKTRIT